MPKCKGRVLHDCHAEVLALRGLNHFLLTEVLSLVQHDSAPCFSPYLRGRNGQVGQENGTHWSGQPFEIRSNVSICMYCSEAPCGDASMEMVMDGTAGDAEPWEAVIHPDGALHGRGYFADLGVVRRKPGRGDAEPTLSKSCSDKLTLKQVTSVLSFGASVLIAITPNAYLSQVVVPADKYSEGGYSRAFGPAGRMAFARSAPLPPAFGFRPFTATVLARDFDPFPFSRPWSGGPASKAGNVSAVFVAAASNAGAAVCETIVRGVRQGFQQFGEDAKKCSALSRWKTWDLVARIVDLVLAQQGPGSVPLPVRRHLVCLHTASSYRELKEGSLGAARAAAKATVVLTLGGWRRNEGDQRWSLGQSA